MYKNKRRTQANKREKPKRVTRNRTIGKEAPAAKSSNSQNTRINRRKIAPGRVTVPLEFFSQGLKSKTVRRNTEECIPKEQSNFLNEDLHALLQTVSVNSTEASPSPGSVPKETSRIRSHFDSVSDYYVSLQPQKIQEKSQESANTKGDCGNSVFKEINRRYQEAVVEEGVSNSNKEEECDFVLSNVVYPRSNITITNNLEIDDGIFCKKLKQQLCPGVLESGKARCIRSINALVAEINVALVGQETVSSLEGLRKSATKNGIQENVQAAVPPQLIPKTEWIFETPSTQKLRQPVAPDRTTELKPCLLQTGVASKVVYQLDTSATDLDFLDTSCNFLATSIYDDANCSMFNLSPTPNDTFKIPSIRGEQNVPPSRTLTSMFSNNNVPLFGDTYDTFPQRKRNSVFPERPSKSDRNIIRENMGNPKCLFFEKTAKRQKATVVRHREEENAKSTSALLREIPVAVTSQTYFQLDRSSSNSKENHRPQDFSNHPKSDEFSIDETFAIDDNFLLPLMPNLSDSMPLPFYPREAFGSE